MSLDLAAATAAIYARLATDAGGAGVRALLGSATSVGPATLAEGGVELLPARPCVLGRPGAVGGASDEMRRATYTWWCYAVPGESYLLAQIVEAIEAAYPPFLIPFWRVAVTLIGQETTDDSLGGLLTRPVQLTYRRRA